MSYDEASNVLCERAQHYTALAVEDVRPFVPHSYHLLVGARTLNRDLVRVTVWQGRAFALLDVPFSTVGEHPGWGRVVGPRLVGAVDSVIAGRGGCV